MIVLYYSNVIFIQSRVADGLMVYCITDSRYTYYTAFLCWPSVLRLSHENKTFKDIWMEFYYARLYVNA